MNSNSIPTYFTRLRECLFCPITPERMVARGLQEAQIQLLEARHNLENWQSIEKLLVGRVARLAKEHAKHELVRLTRESDARLAAKDRPCDSAALRGTGHATPGDAA